jgi:hypothetical protein
MLQIITKIYWPLVKHGKLAEKLRMQQKKLSHAAEAL